jgi:hypothetical protein
MTAAIGTERPRREFLLPEEDVEFLNGLGMDWETIVDGGVQWLLVRAVSLPPGFNVSNATLAIRIVPGYPAAALDMIYVHPPLCRGDNIAIPALSPCSIGGVGYQQWSRHYTSMNPWRPNVDSIASHWHAAEEWLRKAVK